MISLWSPGSGAIHFMVEPNSALVVAEPWLPAGLINLAGDRGKLIMLLVALLVEATGSARKQGAADQGFFVGCNVGEVSSTGLASGAPRFGNVLGGICVEVARAWDELW